MAGFGEMARQLMDAGGNAGGNLGGQAPQQVGAASRQVGAGPGQGDSWMLSPAGILGHIFGSKSSQPSSPAPQTQPPRGWQAPNIRTPQAPAPEAPPAPPMGGPDPSQPTTQGSPGGMVPPTMPPTMQAPQVAPPQTLDSIFQALIGAGRGGVAPGPPMPALSGNATAMSGVPLPSVQQTNPFDAMATRYGAAPAIPMAPRTY